VKLSPRDHKIRGLNNFLASRFPKRFSLALLTLITLIFCLVVACGNDPSPSDIPHASLQTSDCRVVKHVMGETCVPLHPQRVITIDPFSLENVLAFGIQPVGIAASSDWLSDRDYLRDRLSTVESIGDFDQPNLEKILALKPDLILGLTETDQVYSQLRQIAPTVLFDFETSGQWKDILMHTADALGKTDIANQIMTTYSDRLDQFQARMGDRLPELEVSVIRIYPNTISIYASNTFVGSIIEAAGLARPPLQSPTGQLDISKESLQIADGDVIFLWSHESGQARQKVQTEIAKLKADPLWQKLNAVQQGQVYEVPSYWIGSSILSAHAVVDDLFKYLVAN
jgi:iron complex transport system substrate-binding protein